MTLLEVERAPHLEYSDYLGGGRRGFNFSVCMHMCVSSAVSSGEIRLPRETSNVSCSQKEQRYNPVYYCLTLCTHGVL